LRIQTPEKKISGKRISLRMQIPEKNLRKKSEYKLRKKVKLFENTNSGKKIPGKRISLRMQIPEKKSPEKKRIQTPEKNLRKENLIENANSGKKNLRKVNLLENTNSGMSILRTFLNKVLRYIAPVF